MQVCFYLGRANTGKSSAIRERMRAHQRAGERAVLIVPEQYTFEAERMLAGALGGLLGVQVLSFSRLNERLLAQYGQAKPYLSAQGHRMVIRKTILQQLPELGAFGRAAERTGFAQQMQEVFTDCKRAGVTPEMLDACCEKLSEGTALKGKLTDMARIYRETETYLSARYLTLDDAANAATALLPDSFIRGAHVYLDGVDRPSAQLYRWLRALMTAAEDVTVALRCGDEAARDAELFLPDRMIYHRIRAMAEELGAPVSTRMFLDAPAGGPKALHHLERNLFVPDAAAFEGDASAVTVYGATSRMAEVEAVGDQILEQARRGVRFREMAVIVSDPEAYMPMLARAFAAREIPVFMDRKRPVTGHAAVDAVLSALRAVETGFGAGEILRLVKSGYAGVRLEESESLELYLLRTGIKGGGMTKPFARGEVPEAAEQARVIVMEPLMRLQKGLAARRVCDKVEALYRYLVEIRLEEALRTRADALLLEGRVALTEEHAQVWNTLMEALSQLHAIMGDVAVSRKTFCALVEEGLTGCEIGVIPGTSDQVLVGDLARTKSRAVRALFLVGVNEGLLPQPRGDDEIIDNNELETLARVGMPVWSNTKQRAAEDRLELYAALAKGRETLHFSYCFSANGAEMAPSQLITRMRRLFPNCRTGTDLDETDALPVCVRTGLRRLTMDLCALHSDDVLHPRLPAYAAYFCQTEPYAARVRRMLQRPAARYALPPLGRSLSRALYGSRIRMSASRLEQFSACPFKHFVRYGLSAEERREFTEKPTDLGTFYHAALETFVRQVLADGGHWRALTDADTDASMDALLPEVIAAHNNGVFLHHERLRATLFLLIESVKTSARAIVHQVQSGAFTPLGAEVRFGEGQAFPPLRLRLSDGVEAELGGVIDRVDALGGAADPNNAQEAAQARPNGALRVVDYKLSDREFDFAGVLSGLTLQLPLYLAVVTQGERSPAGMYYMPLKAPVVDEQESEERAIREAFLLRGLTVSDPVIVRASDSGAECGAPAVLKGVKCTDGETFSGSVCTRAQMERTLAQARQVAERALTAMLDGHMEVSPVEGACKYCDYRSICRFDPMVRGCRTKKLKKLKQDAFFEYIGGDGI